MLSIVVLVSGGGTNLQAILDACDSGIIKSGRVVGVISSNPEAYALTRAAGRGIPGAVIARSDYNSSQDFDDALTARIDEFGADLIVLA
ncbi:MAG: phosphoribosylglycinamide formyltransferase, partial [Clostridia bacterium]|nr:phosphoribosylglycinamide formyltransferase [Clostridia bacterium]